MKLKFLSLFLVLSVFAFGTNLKAQDSENTGAPATIPMENMKAPGAPASHEEDAALAEIEAQAQINPAGAICTVLTKFGKCTLPCTTMTDVQACFGQIAKNPGLLTTVCDKGCNRLVCKNGTLQGYCMQYCCAANSGKIQNCLKQNGGKTCPSPTM